MGTGHWLKQWWTKFCCHTVTRPQWFKVLVGLRSDKTVLSWYQDTPCYGHTKDTCGSAWISLDKGVYHTDVSINCHAKKKVMKYVGINRYSVIWNIMDITWTMIKLQAFVHSLANSIAYETFNSMKPRDMYGNKWSLFITKMIIDHVVKEQYSLMIIFHQRNTVKCHYNACHYNANARLTRSILAPKPRPHALMTIPELLEAHGLKVWNHRCLIEHSVNDTPLFPYKCNKTKVSHLLVM